MSPRGGRVCGSVSPPRRTPGRASGLGSRFGLPLARISHTDGPKRTRNLLMKKAVTREAKVLSDLTACRIGNTDFQLVAVKEEVLQARHHPDGAAGQGTPDLRSAPPAGGGRSRVSLRTGMVPSRHCPHSRRWRFRARPRFRSVRIAPPAPLCGAVPTGGRRSLACASLRLVAWAQCAMFSVLVAPSATRRALPSMRSPG